MLVAARICGFSQYSAMPSFDFHYEITESIFSEHVISTTNTRMSKAAATLSWIMPNV